MKRSRVALGLFLATFALSLLAVGSVDSGGRVAANPAGVSSGYEISQKCPAALAGYCEFAYDEAPDAWDDFEGCEGISCYRAGHADPAPQSKAVCPACPAGNSFDCDCDDYCRFLDEAAWAAEVANKAAKAPAPRAIDECHFDDAWRTAGNELVDRINDENDGLGDDADIAETAEAAAPSAPDLLESPWQVVPGRHVVWAKRWHDAKQTSLIWDAEAFAVRGGVDVKALLAAPATEQATAESPLRRLGATLGSAVDLWHSYRLVLGQLSRDAVELAGLPELVGRTYVVRTPPAVKHRTTRRGSSFRQEF